MRSFVGKDIEAITLNVDCGAASTEALTDNYLKLQLQGNHDPNRWIRARIDGVEQATLIGAAF